MSKGRILFQFSGSIACFKACSLLSRLVQEGYDVETVATASALEFVGEATLEGLTGRPVHMQTFARGEYMSHIHLMKWADLILLCPATANTMAKMASGVGDDVITTLFLAHDFKKPYLIAPAMNTLMYKHPATVEAMTKLQNWGLNILGTAAGNLACGDVGEGRLLEPERIYEEIERHLARSSANRPANQPTNRLSSASNPADMKNPSPLRVLVTSGGTQEPIDSVRAITNFSTGRTGAALASLLLESGHLVTFVHASDSATPIESVFGKLKKVSYKTFGDLDQALANELERADYDAVIHLAAVSDYALKSIEADGSKLLADGNSQLSETKIDSKNELTLHLAKNPKIVETLRARSRNKHVAIVAFKLTRTSDKTERLEAVRKLARHASADLIVHNDLSEVSPNSEAHIATIYSVDKSQSVNELLKVATKGDMNRALEEILIEISERRKNDSQP